MGMSGRGDLREVPRAPRRSLAKTLVDFAKAFDDRRERWPKPIFLRATPCGTSQPVSAYITLRSVVLFGESDNSELSRDRIDTAKHLHCRIARPDPVLTFQFGPPCRRCGEGG